MLIGLFFMKWDDRVGVKVLDKYPSDIEITQKTLMQIISTHEFSREMGAIQLMDGTVNILSYYSGEKKGYYLALILTLDEDPDEYEGGLADTSRAIIQNLENDAYKELIPMLFKRLSVFPSLTYEQRLASIFQDEIQRIIINRLRDEAITFKSELKIWLKDIYNRLFESIDPILEPILKIGILKETSVKGISADLLLLINDILLLRIPPEKILKNPSRVGLPKPLDDEYISSCKEFFSNYHPSEEDNLRILEVLTDNSLYEILRLLRIAIVTRNDLEKLKKKGVDDIDEALNFLLTNQLIKILTDSQGNKYYALISDIYIDLIFPKYQVNILREAYIGKTKAKQVLLEYCNILKDTYLNLKNPVKIEEEI